MLVYNGKIAVPKFSYGSLDLKVPLTVVPHRLGIFLPASHRSLLIIHKLNAVTKLTPKVRNVSCLFAGLLVNHDGIYAIYRNDERMYVELLSDVWLKSTTTAYGNDADDLGHMVAAAKLAEMRGDSIQTALKYLYNTEVRLKPEDYTIYTVDELITLGKEFKND